MMDALQYSVRQKEMWTINFLTRPINIICSYKYTEGYNLVLLDGNQIKDLPLKYLIFYRLCFNKYWPHGQQWLIILSGNRGRYWMQQQGKRDNFRITNLFYFPFRNWSMSKMFKNLTNALRICALPPPVLIATPPANP